MTLVRALVSSEDVSLEAPEIKLGGDDAVNPSDLCLPSRAKVMMVQSSPLIRLTACMASLRILASFSRSCFTRSTKLSTKLQNSAKLVEVANKFWRRLLCGL